MGDIEASVYVMTIGSVVLPYWLKFASTPSSLTSSSLSLFVSSRSLPSLSSTTTSSVNALLPNELPNRRKDRKQKIKEKRKKRKEQQQPHIIQQKRELRSAKKLLSNQTSSKDIKEQHPSPV